MVNLRLKFSAVIRLSSIYDEFISIELKMHQQITHGKIVHNKYLLCNGKKNAAKKNV